MCLPNTSRSGTALSRCEACRIEFKPQPGSRGRFCSLKCFGASKVKPEAVRCPTCGGVKAWGAKLCQACRALAMRKGKTYPCANCSKPVYKSPAEIAATTRAMGVFCNRDCHAAYVSGPNNPAYVDGGKPCTYARGFRKAKKEVLDRVGRACFLCGETEKPDVHHINRDRQNNGNPNLVTLCRPCHAIQHRPPLADVLKRSAELSRRLSEKFSYPSPSSI